jgi:hypothetical protein
MKLPKDSGLGGSAGTNESIGASPHPTDIRWTRMSVALSHFVGEGITPRVRVVQIIPSPAQRERGVAFASTNATRVRALPYLLTWITTLNRALPLIIRS